MKSNLQQPTVAQIMSSTIMSYLGVSSPSRRQRDFEYGSAKAFIGMEFALLVLFVVCVVSVVNVVLSNY